MSIPVAIIGVGESEYSWDSGLSETELALTAIKSAISDSGLAPSEIDGMMKFSFEGTKQYELAGILGINSLRVCLDSASGAASTVGLVAAAAAAIEAGQADAIICYRAFNGRSMLRLGHLPVQPRNANGHIMAAGNSPFGGEFTGPYGMAAPACAFGLWLSAYMDRYHISNDEMTKALGEIVVRQRAYAGRNPRALLHKKPLDFAGYLASPILAAPLRKADLCLESDGACAFIVAGPKGIKQSKNRPAYIVDTAQTLSPNYDHFFLDLGELPPRIGTHMFPDMLKKHGLTHQDIDVLAIYDASSSGVLIDLENMGFCGIGEAVERVFELRPAVNTSGGLLAEAYLQGMNQVVELVRQMRGQSCNQVNKARLGAISAGGGQGVALFSNEVLS
jgi:acetyl-CoA acetyltransferase